ncbi:MAG TPA: citrate synthase [Clostridiales bacterium]|nr:citrate synthase [Clostridiales bacterium]
MNKINPYTEITPEIIKLSKLCVTNGAIDSALYQKYDVKRGLRDLNGKGVLTGLTEISEIVASVENENGESIPSDGELFYRGVNVKDLVKGFVDGNRFGFEETTYLLLFGSLPTEQELHGFNNLLTGYRSLPTSFVRDIIMKAPSPDMMNTLARSVLTLYSYDDKADDTSIPNVLRQCLQLIALFPLLSVYGYHTYRHYHKGKSFYIHSPLPELSTSENILRLLRPDKKYTELEARVLDVALVLHAEHGGGNNSTFTTHVVSSWGTDTYSAVAAAIGSLKGPKHGGANIKVNQMFDDMKAKVSDWEDEDQITEYLTKILHKEEFDKSGLIYGMGHAVYSLSDPRAEIFKNYVRSLSMEKGQEDEYNLYALVEKIAPKVIAKERKIYKGVSANVDFYSGFVYRMLGLPIELYTPIFAISRISGWSAHRLEELCNASKIIRPSYKSVAARKEYVPIQQR